MCMCGVWIMIIFLDKEILFRSLQEFCTRPILITVLVACCFFSSQKAKPNKWIIDYLIY